MPSTILTTKDNLDKSRARYIEKWKDAYDDAQDGRARAHRRFNEERQELRARYQRFHYMKYSQQICYEQQVSLKPVRNDIYTPANNIE